MKSKWNNKEANLFIRKYKKEGISKELALRIYTTRLLGNDPSVVLHGGGNTSLKILSKNNLNKNEKIIYVKGSVCILSCYCYNCCIRSRDNIIIWVAKATNFLIITIKPTP